MYVFPKYDVLLSIFLLNLTDTCFLDDLSVSYRVVQACFTLGFIFLFCALVTSALLMFDKGKPNYFVIPISMAGQSSLFILFFSYFKIHSF